ncbi:MAG: hypothetical protein GWP19_11610 [Planctomycetia bacterium]|nr:hypothetical protein [Planctomycetia bacterium]
MELIGAIIIVVVIYYAYKASKEAEERRYIKEINKEDEEIKNELFPIERQAKQSWNKIITYIQQNFTLTRCGRCNDINFHILEFNSTGTGVNVECLSCHKKTWFKNKIDDNSFYFQWEKEFQLIKDKADNIGFKRNTFGYDNRILEALSAPLITKIYNKKSLNERHSIPKLVKQEVWQRDNGKCVKCKSKENLEYDHVIPVSKGGANTVRNIQLLCESCNRSKQAKIE